MIVPIILIFVPIVFMCIFIYPKGKDYDSLFDVIYRKNYKYAITICVTALVLFMISTTSSIICIYNFVTYDQTFTKMQNEYNELIDLKEKNPHSGDINDRIIDYNFKIEHAQKLDNVWFYWYINEDVAKNLNTIELNTGGDDEYGSNK